MGVLPECRKRKTTGYPGPSKAVTRWIGDFLRASAIHIFMCVVSKDDCVSTNPQLSQSRGFWTENRDNETGTLTPKLPPLHTRPVPVLLADQPFAGSDR